MAARARAGAHPRIPERLVTTSVASTGSAEPSVFGFHVRTELPLRFLRRGGGASPLEIITAQGESPAAGELLGEWPLQGTAYPARAQLFRVEGGYEYWTSDAGRFLVDTGRHRIAVPKLDDTLLLEQRLHGMPMILSFLSRGDVSLHAAAVEVGSQAVVLAAPSRYGKTTLAFAFQQAGHRVLSEDLICCRPATAEAIPGPALLRLRPDVVSERPLPTGLFVAAERVDRVFVGFDPVAAGSGAPVPIRAIVFLRESAELALEPVAPSTALKDLWRLSFRTGTEDGRADSFRHLSQLAGAVPFWNIHRPLRLDTLRATVELVESLNR
jgi:hypothetical protein